MGCVSMSVCIREREREKKRKRETSVVDFSVKNQYRVCGHISHTKKSQIC